MFLHIPTNRKLAYLLESKMSSIQPPTSFNIEERGGEAFHLRFKWDVGHAVGGGQAGACCIWLQPRAQVRARVRATEATCLPPFTCPPPHYYFLSGTAPTQYPPGAQSTVGADDTGCCVARKRPKLPHFLSLGGNGAGAMPD